MEIVSWRRRNIWQNESYWKRGKQTHQGYHACWEDRFHAAFVSIDMSTEMGTDHSKDWMILYNNPCARAWTQIEVALAKQGPVAHLDADGLCRQHKSWLQLYIEGIGHARPTRADLCDDLLVQFKAPYRHRMLNSQGLSIRRS